MTLTRGVLDDPRPGGAQHPIVQQQRAPATAMGLLAQVRCEQSISPVTSRVWDRGGGTVATVGPEGTGGLPGHCSSGCGSWSCLQTALSGQRNRKTYPIPRSGFSSY